MLGNRVKALHDAGKPSVGLIATLPTPAAVQVLARAGYDWVLIDMEHAPIDLGTAHAMIAATAGTDCVPFVRVAAGRHELAKPLLDAGVMGVCFPMVNCAEDAAMLAGALRYPPQGQRYWGPFYAPLRWGVSMAAYVAQANDAVMAIATLEHPRAVEAAAEIVMTPGLDLSFVGVGDLSVALGLGGQLDHPRLLEAVRAIEQAVLPTGKALGGVARSPDQARALLDRGYRAIVHGFDWMLMSRTAEDYLKALGR